MNRTTHTYAVLGVSKETYQEIRRSLDEAGYSGQFHDNQDGEVIDMHGIAIKERPGKCSECGAGMVRCNKCGAEWCLDHQLNPLVCFKCGDSGHE